MSSSSWSSPLPIPSRFRRNNTSAFSSISVDDHMLALGDAPSSSPLQSSSPLRTPSRPTPGYGCTEWPTSDHSAEPDALYERPDNVEHAYHLWSRHARPEHLFPSKRRPLPSLITKFAAQTRRSDTAPSHSPSPLPSIFQATYFDPQESVTVANDCEEYDLESMDIHIHETYFATSAERGRWLSSPIAPRVRSRATPPMRGHSSPVKRPADSFPMTERLPTRPRFCSVDEQISISLPEDRDNNTRCFSSLPPSSPPFSPMSNLSFLDDDCENDSAVDPHSNSDGYRSRIPELNISSTCTEPVDLVLLPTPHETPTPVHPTDSLSCSLDSMSRHTSSLSGRSPRPIEVHAQALGVEPDDVLSPLSQFELDFVEEEPSKRPLSDTVNKPHPGQRATSSGMIVHAVQNQEGTSSIQSLSMNSNLNLDVSLNVLSGSCSNRKVRKKRRGSTTGNSGTRQTKKRAANRSGDVSSGTKNHVSSHPEPRSKKVKLSHRAEIHGGKSLSRRNEGHSRSPSRPAAEVAGSECAQSHHGKSIKPTGDARPQQAEPESDDAEFQASLTGMLIEAFATSRATSMDSAALYSVLTRAHPQLAEERSKEELVVVIAAVLEAGRVRCGMFDKVDSSGEKSRHQALENRWFYVPERDEDRERASLISAIMPRQKRNETKKYKQYYYRPLDKISRWDPEDAP